MIVLDTPPALILPDHYEGNRPAIIRPGVDLMSYFPIELDRNTRRAIVKELAKSGLIDDRREARKLTDEAAIPFGMFSKARPSLTYILSAAQSGSVTNTTLALGGTTVANDIIVVVCRNSGSSGTDGSISGYTKFYSGGNSSAATRFYFFYKISSGGETTVPTLSNSLAHRKMAAIYRPNFAASTVTVSSMAIATGTNPLNNSDPPAQTHTLTSGTFPKIGMSFYCEDGGVNVSARTFTVSGSNAYDADINTGTNWFWANFGHWNGPQAADLTVDMADFGGNCMNSAVLTIT